MAEPWWRSAVILGITESATARIDDMHEGALTAITTGPNPS